MVTKNSNTQIRSRMEKLARQKSTGVVIAVMLSIFAANLQAARGAYAGGNRSATRSSSQTARSSRSAAPASRGSRTPAGSGSTSATKQQPKAPQPKPPQPKPPQPKPPQPKPPQPKPPQPKPPQPKPPQSKPPKGPGSDVVRNHHFGNHIPAERFHAQFGREHRFRINRPVIVEGRPRFVFGGVAFGIVDPWPTAWYFSDAVYVDNIDGDYFLCNPANPGFRVRINVLS